MQITNQSQLALLWHIRKRAKQVFEKFLTGYLYIEFVSYSTYEKGALKITWVWNVKNAYINSPPIQKIKNELITKYVKQWLNIDKAEKEANKVIKTSIQAKLLWAWYFILLTESAYIDLNTRQVTGVYNQEFYNLLTKAKTDPRLNEVLKRSLAQLLIAINNVLANENKTLQTSLYNYNMTSTAKKLLNLSKKQFVDQIKNRYEIEKQRLSPKNVKYVEWIR